MTCAVCRRLRKRMAEELAKFRARVGASKTGGTAPARRAAGPAKAAHLRAVDEDLPGGWNRRDTIRALLAGVAIVTGLARAELELTRSSAAWWIRAEDDNVRIPLADEKTLEALWRACVSGGGKPDLIVCTPEALDAFKEAIRS